MSDPYTCTSVQVQLYPIVQLYTACWLHVVGKDLQLPLFLQLLYNQVTTLGLNHAERQYSNHCLLRSGHSNSVAKIMQTNNSVVPIVISLTTHDIVHLLVRPESYEYPHPHCYIVAERTTFETAHIATTFRCCKNVLLHSAGRILNTADLLRYNNCYPESTSEFIYIIISCIFVYHLQSTGMNSRRKAKLQ